MTEKARAGIYPSAVPVGYRNADGIGGKRVIIPDPEAGPMITELFERFSAGRYSVKAIVKELNSEGCKLRGPNFNSSVVHQILRKRLYSGDLLALLQNADVSQCSKPRHSDANHYNQIL